MASRRFKILYVSSTFTNITVPFTWTNFAIFWNAWFCKIFFKIHWNNVFFLFLMCFLKFKTQYFLLLFYSYALNDQLIFCIQKSEFLLRLPFLSRLRPWIDWWANLIHSSSLIGSFKQTSACWNIIKSLQFLPIMM